MAGKVEDEYVSQYFIDTQGFEVMHCPWDTFTRHILSSGDRIRIGGSY